MLYIHNTKHLPLNFLKNNKSLVGLVLLIVAVSIATPNFFQIDNILNVLRQTSINAIIAIGMTFVILTAGIDLSVGSILAFSGAVCASLLSIGLPLFSVVFLTLLVGAALGAANGFTISYFNIQPFLKFIF